MVIVNHFAIEAKWYQNNKNQQVFFIFITSEIFE